MVPITIVLIASGIIVVYTIITYIAIRDSNRQAREKNAAMRALEEALAAKTALKEQVERLQETNNVLSESLTRASQDYNLLLREHTELEARNTALQKTLEAQPTSPKRAVQRRDIRATQEEAGR